MLSAEDRLCFRPRRVHISRAPRCYRGGLPDCGHCPKVRCAVIASAVIVRRARAEPVLRARQVRRGTEDDFQKLQPRLIDNPWPGSPFVHDVGSTLRNDGRIVFEGNRRVVHRPCDHLTTVVQLVFASLIITQDVNCARRKEVQNQPLHLFTQILAKHFDMARPGWLATRLAHFFNKIIHCFGRHLQWFSNHRGGIVFDDNLSKT